MFLPPLQHQQDTGDCYHCRSCHHRHNPVIITIPASSSLPQAFERQVDHLSRQLSRAESDMDDLHKERDTLLEELRAGQQVGFRGSR